MLLEASCSQKYNITNLVNMPDLHKCCKNSFKLLDEVSCLKFLMNKMFLGTKRLRDDAETLYIFV